MSAQGQRCFVSPARHWWSINNVCQHWLDVRRRCGGGLCRKTLYAGGFFMSEDSKVSSRNETESRLLVSAFSKTVRRIVWTFHASEQTIWKSDSLKFKIWNSKLESIKIHASEKSFIYCNSRGFQRCSFRCQSNGMPLGMSFMVWSIWNIPYAELVTIR